MSDQNVELRPGFDQVYVFPALRLDGTPVEQFEAQLGARLGARVQYLETLFTLPDHDVSGQPVPNTGGRRDVLFAVHREHDAAAFYAQRLSLNILRLEDLVSPMNQASGSLYPPRVRGYLSPRVRDLHEAFAPQPGLGSDAAEGVPSTQETPPRPWGPQAAFVAGELLQHPLFGVGRVLKVYDPQNLSVMFPTGVRVLRRQG